MMKPSVAWMLLLSTTVAAAHVSSTMCSDETCKAGTHARTYSQTDDPYYECPTRELATYVNTVLGMVAVGVALGAPMPNISPTTGEPEYLGESKRMLDSLRASAHVSTFDEAVSLCRDGVAKKVVTVMNMPKDSLVAWVFDRKANESFWMPIAHLDKIQ
jgi:hypothetical protein